MTDILDRAQVLEEQHRADALARHRERRADACVGPASPQRRCTDCDGAIPAGRRRALPGATRCVECQAVAERP